MAQRVGEYRDTEEEQIALAGDLLSIAESGWDFNPRFNTAERRFAARDFVHLDLNCLLYDVERKAAEMLRILGRETQAQQYEGYAADRKQLMETYMLDKESGLFYDYNFKTGRFSAVLSAASLYPFAVGLSDDTAASKKALAALELPYGLSACAYRGEHERYLQWDHPSMWPSNVYFAYIGLRRIGLTADATRIAEKYLHTVERCFEQTGSLWEKYDAEKGTVSVTNEYKTPEMMGWTAGVYRYLEEELKR